MTGWLTTRRWKDPSSAGAAAAPRCASFSASMARWVGSSPVSAHLSESAAGILRSSSANLQAIERTALDAG